MFKFFESVFLGFYEYLYSLTNDYGLALIIFIFLIRISMLPLSYLIFIEEKKLRKIKPQIDEVLKKIKDNPYEQLEKITEIYKKEKFNPIFNIVIQFLPLPILISIFFVLKRILEEKQSVYFLSFLDLSKINYPLVILVLLFQIISSIITSKERMKEQIIFLFLIGLIIINFPAIFSFYWLWNLIFVIIERWLFEIYNIKFRVISVEKNYTEGS